MQLGVRIPCYRRWCDAGAVRAIAQTAEDLGFDSLWVQDHLVLPTGGEAHLAEGVSGWMDGVAETGMTAHDYYGSDDWWLDPYAVWGFLAGATRRVTLASDIVVIPYRDPIVQAKLLGTLDVLTGGRMLVGTGSGHVRGEFEALGLDYAARGRMHDEHLRIIRALLTGEEVSFAGEFHRFGPVRPLLAPPRRHLPIFVGGNGRASIRRAAELGDGWLPSMVTPDGLRAGLAELDRQSERFGRAARPPVAVSLPSELRMPDGAAPPSRRPDTRPEDALDLIRQYARVGVAHLSLAFRVTSPDIYLRQIETFAREVLPGVPGRAAAVAAGSVSGPGPG
ncbi:conserved hypothetical protein [Frankia canadensis]|uniref:Luciferase-like domain-containing protein n=1 Tax=Frankia canadensis TaxID=1836972 RepID=A0A2I2KR38_9ACTN|nr:TIGR03619 family F420-dependent LLM class oxidoreductase [Frankia canadensis]SNQ48135.1 conserved hypothetical protein [Frankia canadensis]SOU55425.1 conserved hypothetical protein [Frankia canadensis]